MCLLSDIVRDYMIRLCRILFCLDDTPICTDDDDDDDVVGYTVR